ncbi:hypothetical protein QS423_13860 [Staphylococcus pseudintermedius]|nr:hypothetical protein QS423_13860 [Staphylococcus pseudintermedius]
MHPLLSQNAKEHIAVAAKKEYDAILAVTEKMTDDIAPTNRTLFVSPAFYTKIKQLVIALPQGDNKQQVLSQGVQGKIDGFTVVVVENAKEHIAVTAKKEYDAILAVTEKMTDDIAPTNRTLFVSPAFYTKVKQLVIQLPQGDNKQQVLGQGVQGKIDVFTVVVV